MDELTIEEYKRLATDAFKACVGCKHRIKDKGILKKEEESVDSIYGCTLGQVELQKEVYNLPEQCKARNLIDNIGKLRYQFQRPETKKRDNCHICRVYEDEKPTCKDERINFISCPCKTCESFMRTDKGCMNFTEKCRKEFKFTYKQTETI